MKVDAARLLVEFFHVSLGSRIGVGIVGVDGGIASVKADCASGRIN